MPRLQTKALTAARVKNARPNCDPNGKTVETEIPDTDRDPDHSGVAGLVLRVRPAGQKSWLYRYRNEDGRRRKMGLGAYPKLPLAKARRKAEEIAAQILEGRDPAEEKRANEAGEIDPKRVTYEKVVERFVELHCKPNQRTWEQTQAGLLRNCAKWKKRSFASITKRDAQLLLDGFAAEGKKSKARNTGAYIRRLWRWAAHEDIVEVPIMDGLRIEPPAKPRERHYSDGEVKAIWQAADKMPKRDGAFVKLLLLLAPRRNELAGMRRSEILKPDNQRYPQNFRGQNAPVIWTVPTDRTKTKKASQSSRVYITPLNALAQRIIEGLPVMEGGEDLVFPGRDATKPFKPGTKLADAVRELSGVADWTAHAARHTLATFLENRGYSEYERALVLNHSSAGVTSGYSHGLPLAKKADLLEEWSAYVKSLIQPEGVEVLR